MKFKQQSIFHDWNENTGNLEILVILETEDGQYHQMMKKVPKSYFEKVLGR